LASFRLMPVCAISRLPQRYRVHPSDMAATCFARLSAALAIPPRGFMAECWGKTRVIGLRGAR
jgi:hypothetical protein